MTAGSASRTWSTAARATPAGAPSPRFTKGRLTVVRDVESAGSVTFVIDPAGLVYGYYCAGGTAAAALEVGGVLTVVGDTLWQQDVDWDGLVRSGAPEPGFTRAGGGVFYSAHSSSLFGYTLVSAAPWGEYMTTPLRAALIIGLAVAAGFAVVTIFYARKFSKDSVFIQGILQSMSRAECSDFTPVAVGDRRDEYAMIAQHLNSLYEHLQTLIEQRYVLTISQQRAEIQRLSAQLNPHFLYNTLESIRLRALKEGDAHLAEATGYEELRDGYRLIKQVSELTGVPVLYTSGKKRMLDQFLSEGHDPKYIGKPMYIDTYMARDWNSWIKTL